MSDELGLKYVRYAAFGGEWYYPLGGWADHVGSAESLGAAKEYVAIYAGRYEWWHIVDLDTGEIVAHPEE